MGDLERFGFDDVRSAGSDAEKVGIGNDAKGLVIVDDAGLAVPAGVLRKQGAELRRKRECRLEYVRVFLRQAHPHLRFRLLVFSS